MLRFTARAMACPASTGISGRPASVDLRHRDPLPDARENRDRQPLATLTEPKSRLRNKPIQVMRVAVLSFAIGSCKIVKKPTPCVQLIKLTGL